MLMLAAGLLCRMWRCPGGPLRMLSDDMNHRARLFLACLGVVVLTCLPWIFKWSLPIGWVAVGLLVAWTVWLAYEYLTWARGLKR
jgi:hypothetical protein